MSTGTAMPSQPTPTPNSSRSHTARITMTVDGRRYVDDAEARTLLVHHLREAIGKIGTVVGCDTSNCGACTVLMGTPDGPGRSVKSCSVLALQADGASITTIEGLAGPDGSLHAMQRAFHELHALQCGFCTPGMILSAVDLLRDNPDPTEDEVRAGLSGNLCRCTGYQNIVRAVLAAAAELRAQLNAAQVSAVQGEVKL
jgi:carbon-monoxide dehydrogenase small subunit